TTLSSLPSGFTIASGLPNPSSTTYYAVRTFFNATSFKDYVVTLNKKVCAQSDLSVDISPSTDSANEGETLTYTVTLTNNGPDPAIDVAIKVDLPSGLDLVTFDSSAGSYSTASQLWSIATVPLGSQTLTITYKMK
ncbi:MAG: DUF11 domain-containing protein, partial [Saprospiraceae bacterium]|nr:DUF11 domain-containing protein [Saprospiraceae bacterium]